METTATETTATETTATTAETITVAITLKKEIDSKTEFTSAIDEVIQKTGTLFWQGLAKLYKKALKKAFYDNDLSFVNELIKTKFPFRAITAKKQCCYFEYSGIKIISRTAVVNNKDALIKSIQTVSADVLKYFFEQKPVRTINGTTWKSIISQVEKLTKNKLLKEFYPGYIGNLEALINEITRDRL